jgi:hypothetical protein
MSAETDAMLALYDNPVGKGYKAVYAPSGRKRSRRSRSASRQYSDAEKAEYYKKKYMSCKKTGRSSRSGYGYGNAIGSYIAPGIGGRIGGAVGAGLAQLGSSLISGHGDYTVRKNALIYNRDAVPRFTNDKRCTVITHREFIKDIRSSVNFESAEFLVNPGHFETFPWLSKIAQNFEEYIFQGIVFEFKTNSATAVSSTNTALGSVCMASQYNTLAPSFTAKQQIENYEFANSSVPCSSFLHAIECDPATGNEIKSIYNERDSDINADPRNYNLCRTTIATQGMQEASTIGELWVTYKVCLMKPRLGNNDNLADYYQLTDVIGTAPLGQTDMIPSIQNVGFTKQYSTNVVEFDPAFQGVVAVTCHYEITDFGAVAGTEFRCPTMTPATSNIIDVTEAYLGSHGTMNPPRVERTENTGFVPISCSVTQYFQISGGFSTAGNPASISFNGLIKEAGLVLNDSAGRLSIVAIPSQAVTPSYI